MNNIILYNEWYKKTKRIKNNLNLWSLQVKNNNNLMLLAVHDI